MHTNPEYPAQWICAEREHTGKVNTGSGTRPYQHPKSPTDPSHSVLPSPPKETTVQVSHTTGWVLMVLILHKWKQSIYSLVSEFLHATECSHAWLSLLRHDLPLYAHLPFDRSDLPLLGPCAGSLLEPLWGLLVGTVLYLSFVHTCVWFSWVMPRGWNCYVSGCVYIQLWYLSILSTNTWYFLYFFVFTLLVGVCHCGFNLYSTDG